MAEGKGIIFINLQSVAFVTDLSVLLFFFLPKTSSVLILTRSMYVFRLEFNLKYLRCPTTEDGPSPGPS